MSINKLYIVFFALVTALPSFCQEISNIHFEQVGKQIHIYYYLEGDEAYTIQVFCSTDNGNKWGEPLRHVTEAVGENQKAGKGKVVVWDVLAEREKLSGEILFKIKVGSGKNSTFTDARDGQTYKWVKIGNQVWMAENLNYNTENSWCYRKKTKNCDIYGCLYNWNAARTACPSGWHLPTDKEWKTLEMQVGMSQSEADDTGGWRGSEEGIKLKSTSGWKSIGNGTDEVGLTALPGGWRNTNGVFQNLGYYGFWWSATEYNSTIAWYRNLGYLEVDVYRSGSDIVHGFSVRCVKN